MTRFWGKVLFGTILAKCTHAILVIKAKGIHTKLNIRMKDMLRNFEPWLEKNRYRVAKNAGYFFLFVAVLLICNQYVKNNMNDVYRVFIQDQLIGEMSSPLLMETLLTKKLKQASLEHPNARWVLDREQIRIERKSIFRGAAEDAETLATLDAKIQAKPTGVQIIINGKALAIVKDEATAKEILDQVKQRVSTGQEIIEGVTTLAASTKKASDDRILGESKTDMLSVRILEPIELLHRDIKPNDVMDKKTVIDLLINGNIQPAKYVVKEGDTPSTIAEKLDVPLQLIYNKNQHHKDLIDRDLIRIGDLLDVTMPKPAVTIESVQKVTETIAITHEIIYKEDKTMRNGSTKTIRPGKDGVKKVTYLLTRMNGFMVEEEITNEIIIDEPIPAIVKRGTRIIRGEGSGKFIWPVMSGRVSSGYGKRWGRQHKGIDIVSRNRNILVADHGKVIFAGRKDDYGNAVIVDHKNGYQTLYAHLSKITVKEGSIVEKGDKIGIMGDTGRSFGVHLHFEVIVNGKEKNPMSYLRI